MKLGLSPVSGDDEVNIVAASMAKAMGARRSLARVYAPVFRDLSTFDYQNHFNIDRMLSLEHLSAMELARGIRSPGSVWVENFARGELERFSRELGKSQSHSSQSIADLKADLARVRGFTEEEIERMNQGLQDANRRISETGSETSIRKAVREEPEEEEEEFEL